MRKVMVKDLVSGMILARNIKLIGSDTSLVESDMVLCDKSLALIKNYLPKESKVTIYDEYDLNGRFMCDSYLTNEYINSVVSVLGDMVTAMMIDTDNFSIACSKLRKYLYTNRSLLSQLVNLQTKHFYTYSHSINVTLYALLVGINLNLSDDELYDLIVGSIFHDVGKLKISNNILNKPTRLTSEEFKAIRLHPIYGARVVDKCDMISDRARNVILQHHERLDGSGYPYGIKGDEIDYLSKIVGVCDIFDAVISKRSYHENRTVMEGVSVLKTASDDGKLDSDIVNCFCSQVSLPIGDNFVKLPDGSDGIIIDNTDDAKSFILTSSGNMVNIPTDEKCQVVKA